MNLPKESCPVCNEVYIKPFCRVKNGKLVQCQCCQLIFFTPRPSLEELADFYNTATYREGYESSTMAGRAFAKARYKQLQNAIAHHAPLLLTKPDKCLLDVGCGVGDLLSVATQVGWEITGTELSSIAVAKANKLIGNRVLMGDILSLNMPENTYDLITIYHVIEHLLDPVKTLEKIYYLLKPTGIAFIETPNIGSFGSKIRGEKWSQIKPPEHINYFQMSSLKYALKQAGFQQFSVFTNAPIAIESLSDLPQVFKITAGMIYRIAPLFNLGAVLQAVALKG